MTETETQAATAAASVTAEEDSTSTSVPSVSSVTPVSQQETAAEDMRHRRSHGHSGTAVTTASVETVRSTEAEQLLEHVPGVAQVVSTMADSDHRPRCYQNWGGLGDDWGSYGHHGATTSSVAACFGHFQQAEGAQERRNLVKLTEYRL